jgi:hypothetical protein
MYGIWREEEGMMRGRRGRGRGWMRMRFLGGRVRMVRVVGVGGEGGEWVVEVEAGVGVGI